MKKLGILVLCVTALAFVLTGCQDLSGYAKTADLTSKIGTVSGQTTVCMTCHQSDTSTSNFKAAKAGWEASGHANGLRHLDPNSTSWVSEFAAEGSNSCTKCHTGTGFADWATNGPTTVTPTASSDPVAYTNTSGITESAIEAEGDKITCFACHDPHTTYTMARRVAKNTDAVKGVPLPSGNNSFGLTVSYTTDTYFNGGEGNVCANCHQSRRSPTAKNGYFKAGSAVSTTAADLNATSAVFNPFFVKATTAFTPTKGGSPHPAEQADFMLGKDNAASTIAGGAALYSTYTLGYNAPAAFAANPHYVGDTCVTCHITQGGDHSMYLTTNTGDSTSGDNLASCVYCHTASNNQLPAGSTKTLNTSGKTFATAVSTSTLLTDIQTAKRTLLNYFGDPQYFWSPDLNNGDGKTSATAYSYVMSSNGSSGAIQAATVSATSGSVVGTPQSGSKGAVNFAAGASIIMNHDWTTGTNYYFQAGAPGVAQAQAFYNFMSFVRDHSEGVHNPKYAAELLYDAQVLLSITPTWTARP